MRRWRDLFCQCRNDQPVQAIAGNDGVAVVEERKDTPGPDEDVDVVVHSVVGKPRLGVHVCYLGEVSVGNVAAIEDPDTGGVVRLIDAIALDEQVVVNGRRRRIECTDDLRVV